MDMSPKRWSASFEPQVREYWEKNKTYIVDLKQDSKPFFVIDTPPPYASGRWHLGGAVHYAQIDMIARFKRMQGSGYEVIFPACVDRNGLPIEVKVEQELGISMHEFDRKKFLNICRKELDKYEKNVTFILKAMGCSMNTFYGNPDIFYRTDSDDYRFMTQKTFIELWKKKLIYKSDRPNNYCYDCGTTIADAEIEYEDVKSQLHYIKFQIVNKDEKNADTSESITIVTTRPELIHACLFIVFNPGDKRYTHLENELVRLPLSNRTVPIFSHVDASMEFGTGIMMVCSFGDKDDVKKIRDRKVEPIILINQKGLMTSEAGKYAGMKIEEARKHVISDLKEQEYLIKSEDIEHRIPVCWRSRTPIEIIGMEEHYLQQLQFLDDLKEVVNTEIRFFPPESRKILMNWMNSVTIDWPISRRRYYGTSIPVWYCKECGEANVPESIDRYYNAWSTEEECPIAKCKKCGQSEFTGELGTFDTWFDSSVSELYACFYDRDDDLFKKTFPCSLRPQGKEIVRTWLYYTLLRAYQLFEKPAFRNVWISGLVLDPYSKKMSKSLGNIVDPLAILQPKNISKNTPAIIKPDPKNVQLLIEALSKEWGVKKEKINLHYGADALRLTSCMQGSHGSDIRFSWDKLAGNSKFLTKLWNLAKFTSNFDRIEDDEGLKFREVDKWIITSLHLMIRKSLDGYEKLDFSIPAETIYHWVWNVFAPNYVELAKSRAYSNDNNEEEKKAAHFTLYYCLERILIALAPICPFITEYIYQGLWGQKSVHLQLFPKLSPAEHHALEDTEEITKILQEFNSIIWKEKQQRKISMKESIESDFLPVPEKLEGLKDDLRIMHNFK